MAKPLKPWFGTGGDRTLNDQLKGLDGLVAVCEGHSVLDLGCAEGDIGIHLARNGAIAVHGVDFRKDFIDKANVQRGDLPCTFEVADLNEYQPRRQYDIVLMLGMLHKLADPADACVRFAKASRGVVVIRLPPKTAPIIVDIRSGNKPANIGIAMSTTGFSLCHAGYYGHFGEWVAQYDKEERYG